MGLKAAWEIVLQASSSWVYNSAGSNGNLLFISLGPGLFRLYDQLPPSIILHPPGRDLASCGCRRNGHNRKCGHRRARMRPWNSGSQQ